MRESSWNSLNKALYLPCPLLFYQAWGTRPTHSKIPAIYSHIHIVDIYQSFEARATYIKWKFRRYTRCECTICGLLALESDVELHTERCEKRDHLLLTFTSPLALAPKNCVQRVCVCVCVCFSFTLTPRKLKAICRMFCTVEFEIRFNFALLRYHSRTLSGDTLI